MRYLVPRQISFTQAMKRVQEGHTLVATGLVAFRLDDTQAFLNDQAMWAVIKSRWGEKGLLDLWMPKHGAEFLVLGSAQAPEPVTSMDISVRCGLLRKRLTVCGDRHWVPGPLGWKACPPRPFTDMPIVWERSFGGPGALSNADGVGVDAMTLIEAGQVAPLPNILPHGGAVLHPEDEGVPVGFMPRQRTAEVPATSGTFDAAWLARRFPVMPEDFRADFFNLAPLDQRISGAWQGGEEVVIEGMNAVTPRQTCTIPALRMRCFHTRDAGGELIEQATRMDTIALFPSDGVCVLIFRAEIENAGHNGKFLADIMMGLENTGDFKPLEHYRQVWQRRTDSDTRMDHLLADHELMPLDARYADAQETDSASDLGPQRAAAARAEARLLGASAALGSEAMARVLASQAPSAHVVAPLSQDEALESAVNRSDAVQPNQADSSGVMDEIPDPSEGLTRLAHRIASETQTPLASIMDEWMAKLGLAGGMPPEMDVLADKLPIDLVDDPKVRQQMAKTLLDSAAKMKDFEQESAMAMNHPALRAMLDGDATVQINGKDVVVPDLQVSAQAFGKPGLATQLTELDLLLKGGHPNAFDVPQMRHTLKSILSNFTGMEKLPIEKIAELETLLPEGALSSANVKGLVKYLVEGASADGNPLVQAMRQSGQSVQEVMRSKLQAVLGDDARQLNDVLDDMFEKTTPDLLEEMGRREQLGLAELMQMLDADNASDAVPTPEEPDGPQASDNSALESALLAHQEEGAETPHESENVGDVTQQTKQAAPDVAQARRDSRGQQFRPVEMSEVAAKALGEAVIREHKAGHSFKDRDLAGADLSGADLAGADLSGALLEGANLVGADLSHARCIGAVFIGACMDMANCTGADFSHANLSQVQAAASRWSSASLSSAVLAQAQLTGARMERSTLDNCDAVDANLRQVDLSHSTCMKGDFSRADLSGTRLVFAAWTQTLLVGAVLDGCEATQASLARCLLLDAKGDGANLAHADLEDCTLIGACLPNVHAPGLQARNSSWNQSRLNGATLDGANFEFAHFQQADLSRGSLNHCNFKEALLTDADLQCSSLVGAQLCGATLQCTNLMGAGLQQANLFAANLDGAVLDRCDLSRATLDRTLLSLPTHV